MSQAASFDADDAIAAVVDVAVDVAVDGAVDVGVDAGTGTGVSAFGPREWVLQPGQFAQLPGREFQELWFELRTWSWKSLAVVPTSPGASELDVAEKLVVVAVANTNRRMSLISAEGATVADTDRVIAMIRAAEARGDRVIVATDSITENPAAAPIIRAVNGTVLSVRLGRSDKADVERSVAAINRNRIVGMITRG